MIDDALQVRAAGAPEFKDRSQSFTPHVISIEPASFSDVIRVVGPPYARIDKVSVAPKEMRGLDLVFNKLKHAVRPCHFPVANNVGRIVAVVGVKPLPPFNNIEFFVDIVPSAYPMTGLGA